MKNSGKWNNAQNTGESSDDKEHVSALLLVLNYLWVHNTYINVYPMNEFMNVQAKTMHKQSHPHRNIGW